MFQAGMKRDFLSSPSFGSGIVRKGIYLMGVFLHSSEHWLVVMASVMTEILWSTQISISTVWFHQITKHHQAPSCLTISHFYFALQNNQHLFSRLKFTQKLCGFSKSLTKRCKWKFIVFQLCFFLTQWCPVARSPQHSWHRLKRLILKYHYDLPTWCGPAIFSPDWSWWFADAAAAGGGGGTIYHEERERERRPWHWSQWLHSVLSQ